MAHPEPLLLTVDDVADLLSLKRGAVYRLAESRDPVRRLPSVKIGQLLRFRRIDVEAYVEGRAR